TALPGSVRPSGKRVRTAGARNRRCLVLRTRGGRVPPGVARHAHGSSGDARARLGRALASRVSARSPARTPRAGAVAFYRGGVRRGLVVSRRASEILPLPQYVATYGDLLRRAGHRAAAQRQYALVGAIARLERVHGVNVDLEIALFDVDHGIGLRRTVALARVAQRERPSIDGDDVLAWALARN